MVKQPEDQFDEQGYYISFGRFGKLIRCIYGG